MVLVFYYILLHRLLRVYFTWIWRCVMEGREREKIFSFRLMKGSLTIQVWFLYIYFSLHRIDVKMCAAGDGRMSTNAIIYFRFFLQGVGALILDSYFPVDIDQFSSF